MNNIAISSFDVENVLANTLNYILLNPLIYFSESDIHSIFFTNLSKDIPALIELVDTEMERCSHRNTGSNNIEQLVSVKTSLIDRRV